jgi:hypothetical protein
MSLGDPSAETFNMHGTFAVILFLCIAYLSIFRARDTLVLVENATLARRYQLWYRICGIFMVVSPLVAFAASTVLAGSTKPYKFFIETVGIYAFAVYWLLKSRELARTNAELHAVGAKLSATAEGAMSLVAPVSPVPPQTPTGTVSTRSSVP